MLYLLYSLCLHHTLLTRPAIPQQWVTDDGYIRLCVAKGTLVRYTPLACYMPLASYTPLAHYTSLARYTY